jgi:hypothetical protein
VWLLYGMVVHVCEGRRERKARISLPRGARGYSQGAVRRRRCKDAGRGEAEWIDTGNAAEERKRSAHVAARAGRVCRRGSAEHKQDVGAASSHGPPCASSLAVPPMPALRPRFMHQPPTTTPPPHSESRQALSSSGDSQASPLPTAHRCAAPILITHRSPRLAMARAHPLDR